jgi:hypothetical protein
MLYSILYQIYNSRQYTILLSLLFHNYHLISADDKWHLPRNQQVNKYSAKACKPLEK